jgi:hypothetical protein
MVGYPVALAYLIGFFRYLPSKVEQNDSNKFYFMCKFNKLQAPVYSIPLVGQGEGGGQAWHSSERLPGGRDGKGHTISSIFG